MFDWVKKSPSSGVFDSAWNRPQRLWSSGSTLSSEPESFNSDPESSGTFCWNSSAKFANRRKKISRRIASIFGKKSKVVPVDDEANDRASVSLIEDHHRARFEENDTEEKPLAIDDPKSSKVLRRKKSLKRIFICEGSNNLFRRRPLDEYAMRRMRLARDSAGRSSSSSSLSSLLNAETEMNAPNASSAIDGPMTVTAEVHGEAELSFSTNSESRESFFGSLERRLSRDFPGTSERNTAPQPWRSVEDFPPEDNSYVSLFRDSGIDLGENTFPFTGPSNESSDGESSSGVNSTDSTNSNLKQGTKSRSTSCVKQSHTSTPLKNATHILVSASEDESGLELSGIADNSPRNPFWNHSFLDQEEDWEDFWNSRKMTISKSADQLLHDDLSECHDAKEFTSLDELPCSSSRISVCSSDCIRREEKSKIDLGNGIDRKLIVSQFTSANNEETWTLSSNSYVISMYV